MKYKAVSQYSMSIREGHSVYDLKVGTLSPNRPIEGDLLWIAEASAPNVMRGDKWLRVQGSRWIAIVHLGKEFCKLTQIGDVPPVEPPVEPPDVTIPERVILLIDGKEYGYNKA